MAGEPKWLLIEAVRAIHLRQIAEHGGEPGVRDEGAIASALARPLNLWACSASRPDLAHLAAAYAVGISKNHPFVDGNKRVSYVACRTFLLINGVDFRADPAESYSVWMRLAEGDLPEKELAGWLRTRLKI